MPVTLELDQLPVDIEMASPMTAAEFFHFCSANPDLRAELSSKGVIRIMPPCALESDDYGVEIGGQLREWAKKDGRGRVSGSSAGFSLPDGSVMSADATWSSFAQRDRVGRAQRRQFPRLVPEFVLEVMSPSDRLAEAQEKMRHWMANGVELGWLLHPEARAFYVYRAGQRLRKVVDPAHLAASPPLEGFVLDLTGFWE